MDRRQFVSGQAFTVYPRKVVFNFLARKVSEAGEHDGRIFADGKEYCLVIRVYDSHVLLMANLPLMGSQRVWWALDELIPLPG